jgi:two-component system chemotaxis response regulator CheY
MTRRAIVVDDSRAMRSILSAIVDDLGFSVEQASDGRDALVKLRQASDIELALVDWNMPEMNGLELVAAIRQLPEFDALRIVMVTTETEADRVVEALDSGADEYIMKPFDRDMLLAKLAMVGIEPPGTEGGA